MPWSLNAAAPRPRTAIPPKGKTFSESGTAADLIQPPLPHYYLPKRAPVRSAGRSAHQGLQGAQNLRRSLLLPDRVRSLPCSQEGLEALNCLDGADLPHAVLRGQEQHRVDAELAGDLCTEEGHIAPGLHRSLDLIGRDLLQVFDEQHLLLRKGPADNALANGKREAHRLHGVGTLQALLAKAVEAPLRIELAAELQHVALKHPLDAIAAHARDLFHEFLQEGGRRSTGHAISPLRHGCICHGRHRRAGILRKVARSRAHFQDSILQRQKDGRVQIKLLRQVCPQERNAISRLHAVFQGLLIDRL
eukprot:CAMPEP_0115763270 /NCGR_PEP_ID=MMETSP0272-20121206/101452_1 /TAXON_ID=71861 /ORGANISM="Scrippsiella trochoidea, Strain CCMP3099" /LENGTH=304 /DNA_ID=CAMNT_0003209009 /DNA_START=285 /DNA_END=1201 /DNA_ORIENTATION=+